MGGARVCTFAKLGGSRFDECAVSLWAAIPSQGLGEPVESDGASLGVSLRAADAVLEGPRRAKGRHGRKSHEIDYPAKDLGRI